MALAVPSVLGGVAGALLLLRTSERAFDEIVPWLVIGATTLFLLQRTIFTRLRAKRGVVILDPAAEVPEAPSAAIIGYQFLVGVYGGYFGAGIGILMLAALGFMGFSHIHRMNGLKNWLALCMNGIAAVVFAVSGVVDWPVAILTAIGAMVGGYAGSRIAQRVPQERVRQAVAVIGFASGLWLLITR